MKKKIHFRTIVLILIFSSILWSINCSAMGKKIKKVLKALPQKSNYTNSTSPGGVKYEKINIFGETAKMGVFDPSVEYDSSGKVGWLAYTAIEFPNMSTHIAKTTDHGKTWRYVAKVNPAIPGKLIIARKAKEGMWRNEVSSLVHDPDDPGKEWKLFSHKYWIKAPYKDYKGGKPLRYMFIAYKEAASPEKLSLAEEIVLFGAGPSPVEPKKAKYNLNEFHPDLSKSGIYTEPGTLYMDGTLYLSLSAVGKTKKENLTFLLASTDHGKNWNYIGKLTDYKDAEYFSSIIMTASSLVKEHSRVFLLIAPVVKEGKQIMHKGTYIFEFEDITKAKLKRDGNGNLVVHKYYPPSIISHNAGESDYDQNNTNGGIIMSQEDKSGLKKRVDPRSIEIFKIFSTGKKIID